MLRNLPVRKWILLLWGCALAFGFGFAVPQARALDASCIADCNNDCGRGNCGSVVRFGCTCYWSCDDGTSGESTCA